MKRGRETRKDTHANDDISFQKFIKKHRIEIAEALDSQIWPILSVPGVSYHIVQTIKGSYFQPAGLGFMSDCESLRPS